MNRSGRLLAIGLALAGACSTAAWAGAISQAGGYFAARAKARVAAVPFETLCLHPDEYRRCLIEIRGTVTGNARREDGATLILNTANSGTYMVEASGSIVQQGLEAGSTIRVLARVPEGLTIGHLRLVAAVSEYDATAFETEHPARVAAAPKPRTTYRAPRARSQRAPRSSRRVLASRGTASYRGLSVLEQYAQAVIYFNRRLTWDEALRIAQSILGYSLRYPNLDARLVMAVIAVESNFNANAVSSKGAMGLGQLMPGTASSLGVGDPWSPEQNIEGATRLLSGHLAQMSASAPTEDAIRLALACYNAGAGAVKKHRGIPPYHETQRYVEKVTRLYYQMCGQPVP